MLPEALTTCVAGAEQVGRVKVGEVRGTGDGVQREGRADEARRQLVRGVAHGLLQPGRRARGGAKIAWFGTDGVDKGLAGGGVGERAGYVLTVKSEGEDETALQEPSLGVTPTI